jgi:hypothetical protein
LPSHGPVGADPSRRLSFVPPIELIVDLLLHLVLPAIAGSAIAAWLTARLLPERWRHLGVAGALAAGLLIGNWMRGSPLPLIPDGTGWPWLLPMALVLLFAAGTAQASLQNRKALPVVYAAMVMLAAFCLVPRDQWSPAWLLGFACLAFANTVLLDRHAQQKPHWLSPIAWAGVFLGAAAVLVYSHSARLADAALLLAAALAGVGVVTARLAIDARAAGLTVGIYLPGLMLSGYSDTYSEVPWMSFGLMAGAPVVLLATWLRVFTRRSVTTQRIVEVSLLFLPTVAALALAIRAEGFAVGY